MSDEGRQFFEHLDRSAVSVSLFRPLKNGGCRSYSTVTWEHCENPWRAINHQLRMALSNVKPETTDEDFAVMDILDANDDIVQEFGIPTPDAFQWWKRKLRLRLESEDSP